MSKYIYKNAYKYKANKQRKYFIIFIWTRQGLTLVLHIFLSMIENQDTRIFILRICLMVFDIVNFFVLKFLYF